MELKKELSGINYKIPSKHCYGTKWKILLFLVTILSIGVNTSYAIEVNGAEDTPTKAIDQDSRTIKGVVKDVNEEPLPGVSIIVKGTTNGVVTDMDGKFNLSNVEDGTTLVFSFIGMKKQEILLEGQSDLQITMEPSTIGLEEMVVVGYGSLKKKSVTGSLGLVDNEELAKSSEPTISSALVGKVGGISSRQNTGKPGAGANIQIRNFGAPLYVIDGIQKDGGQFANLDANDIESITVLKDASAAIYGIQSANGVIVVETKQGKRNTKNEINVQYRHGWQNFTRFPEMLNAAEWVELNIERDMNLYGKTNWTRDEFAKWQQGTEKGYQSFDWHDFILNKNAPQTYFHIDAGGGGEKSKYYISYSNVNQEGMFGRNDFNRHNVQSNIEMELAEGLDVGMNINGRIEERDGTTTSLWWDDFYIYSEAMFRNRPTERPYANDNPLYPADNGPRSYVNTAAITKSNSGNYNDTWRVLQGNMFLNYDTPIKGLSVKLLASYYYADQTKRRKRYSFDLYTYDSVNDEYVVTGGDSNQLLNIWYSSVEENMYRGQINYVNSFDKHSISAMFVAEGTQRKNPFIQIEGTPVTDALDLLKTDEFSWLDDRYTKSARAGFAGRINYSYADKYILELSGRYDGSYKFLPEDRWGFFPSVLAAYRVNEENFWKNAGLDKYISNFKLRGSYGIVGDDGIVGSFDYYDGYNYGVGKQVLQPNKVTAGIEQRGMPNTNMTWLKVKTLNIGIDIGAFNNKLNLTADFFTRTRDGWPATKNDIVIPNEMGFSLPRENLNSDKDIGWDASVSYTDKAGQFNYDLGFNIGYSRRKTDYIYNPQYSNSIDDWRRNPVDRWQGIDWGYISDGQFQSQEEIDNHPIDNDGRGNSTMLPGDIKHKDLNGDGKITWNEDTRAIGYNGGLPLLNFGITGNFSWKGFDLFMLWQGAGKYKYYRDWEIQKPMPGDGNSPAFFTDRWHRADLFDPNSEWIPGTLPSTGSWSVGENNNYDKRSDFWMINVNYVRLKNIELGYNVPEKYVNKIKLNGVRLYFSGTNLLTFDNVDVVDPELSRTNAVSYPPVKTYNFGIKVNL